SARVSDPAETPTVGLLAPRTTPTRSAWVSDPAAPRQPHPAGITAISQGSRSAAATPPFAIHQRPPDANGVAQRSPRSPRAPPRSGGLRRTLGAQSHQHSSPNPTGFH